MTAATTDALRWDVELAVPVAPLPAPRPRVSKFGAYYPASYTAFLKALQAAIAKPARTLMGELVVAVECICPKPKTSKFTTPAGDCDNLAKGPLDALTKLGYYGDDRQITLLNVRKRFPEPGEEPHIRIQIKEST